MVKPVQPDLAPERQLRLREFLRQRGSARVDEICRALHVSPATARRDLEQLAAAGRVRRVHGGAMSVESRLDEPLFDDKASIRPREKRAIAEKAAALVAAGSTLYLDGGSTVLELARLLADRADLTVVTNSLRAAAELSGRGPRLILTGGELRRLSQTLVGALSAPVLGQLHVDLAFMGTMGLSAAHGLTTTDPAEAFTKKLAMSRAERVVLLADRTKAGKILLAHAGALDDVDVVITDRGLDADLVRDMRRRQIEVVIV